jgi:hypothetical protein
MMMRALIAAGLFVLGSASAFAGTCDQSSATGLPPDFGFFLTTSPSGELSGATDPPNSYTECTIGGTNYIPFYLPNAALVSIEVADLFSLDFDLIVNGGSNILPTTPGSNDVDIDVPAGVSTLGIFVPSQDAALCNCTPTVPTDFMGVSISLINDITIPEPATLGLLGFGAACVVAVRRRRQRQA